MGFNEARHSRRDVWSGRIFFFSTVLVVLATAFLAITREFKDAFTVSLVGLIPWALGFFAVNNASYHTLDDNLRKVADRYIKMYAILLIPHASLGILSYIFKA